MKSILTNESFDQKLVPDAKNSSETEKESKNYLENQFVAVDKILLGVQNDLYNITVVNETTFHNSKKKSIEIFPLHQNLSDKHEAHESSLAILNVNDEEFSILNLQTTRKKFPENFKFGFATAAFQIEGALNEDNRGKSIWDTFIEESPGKIKNNQTSATACDSYHLYEKDVEALKSVGAQFYRFSISWSRVLPNGVAQDRNEDGIVYYHNLIDALLENGIEPVVTMYHWDLPIQIHKYGGFLNSTFANYFSDYADLLFREYGNKVKRWITFNEPLQYCQHGYAVGNWPPELNLNEAGMYLCGKNTIIAHAKAYQLYEKRYKKDQNGKIGITLNGVYVYPNNTQSEDDMVMAEKLMQFTVSSL